MHKMKIRLTIIHYLLAFILAVGVSVAVVNLSRNYWKPADGTLASSVQMLVEAALLYGLLYLGIAQLQMSSEERSALFISARPLKRLGYTAITFPLLSAVFVTVVINLLLKILWPALLELIMASPNLTVNMTFDLSWHSILSRFLYMVVLAPLVEEYLIRGILFNLLNEKISFGLSLFISSLFFGVLHGAAFIQTALIGAVLGWIYHVSGSLKFSIAAHSFNNLYSLAMGILLSTKVISLENPIMAVFSILMLLLGAVVFIILLIQYLKHSDWRQSPTPCRRVRLDAIGPEIGV